MDKKIRSLDVEEILFFDIETVRRNRELDVNSKEYELYSWSIRDKTTGFIPPAIEVKKHYEKMGALKSQYNKVVTVSVGYIKDRILYYKSIVGTQTEIVKQFYSMVESTGFKVCGHNIIGFDLPVLRLKAFEEGIDLSNIPEAIIDSNKKPWDLEKFVLDTMKILTGTYFYNISLDDACMMKGIKSSKDDISGAYVSQVYYDEGVTRIAKYCNKDVIATAELFCALQGKEEGYITEYVDKGNEVLKEKEPINVLEHLLSSGNLTNKVVDSIVDFTEREGLNKEDVLTLVKTALSKTKDYQKVVEEDYLTLKEALGLTIDYSLIQVVVDKGNLGAKEVKELIKQYKGGSEENKKEVYDLTVQFLTEYGKIGQKRASEALKLLAKEFKLKI